MRTVYFHYIKVKELFGESLEWNMYLDLVSDSSGDESFLVNLLLKKVEQLL